MIIVIIKHDFSITILRPTDVHKCSERGHKEPISNTHTTYIIKGLQRLQIGGYHKMQRPKCEHNRNVWW